MPRRYRPVSSGFVMMLPACGSEPQNAAVWTSPSESARPITASATLSGKPVSGFPDIAIPEVSGIDAGAAQRINAPLAMVRERAARHAAEYRTVAGSQPSTYRFAAQRTYNAYGILSLRITGATGCSGAHGNTIAEARTFELSSGAEVDLVEASGQARGIGCAWLSGQGRLQDLYCRRSGVSWLRFRHSSGGGSELRGERRRTAKLYCRAGTGVLGGPDTRAKGTFKTLVTAVR